MMVCVVWVQKVCIRQQILAKQNVSQVSHGKALPASYLRNTVVSIYPDSSHSSHVQGICIISWDAQLRDTCENSSVFNCLNLHTLFLSITQPLQLNPTINTGYKRLNKITIKFSTELKPTKHIVVNYKFTDLGLSTYKKQKSKYLILNIQNLTYQVCNDKVGNKIFCYQSVQSNNMPRKNVKGKFTK